MTGSPPPMRGKAVLQTTFSHRHRITPAYAGKSLKRRMRQFGCQDHPRLCGEKGVFQTSHDRAVGSPPPMRGKVPHSFVHHLSTRITPAYAGKSTWLMIRPYRQTDHPRLCGEKVPEMLQFSSVAGSPPPMRGKDRVKRQIHRCTRITPAYAGKREFSRLPMIVR